MNHRRKLLIKFRDGIKDCFLDEVTMGIWTLGNVSKNILGSHNGSFLFIFSIQYSSLLDETPASSGGRCNYWRKLNLKNIPRTMIIYDIVDYAESGIISSRLQKEMKYLLQRPGTEEMRQHQLQIVSEVR